MSDDVVERYRIRQRERSGPGGCVAVPGFVLSLFAMTAAILLSIIVRNARGGGWGGDGLNGGFAAAGVVFYLLMFLALFAAAATVFGFILNLAVVKSRRAGRTTKTYGLLGLIGLMINMITVLVSLTIFLMILDK